MMLIVVMVMIADNDHKMGKKRHKSELCSLFIRENLNNNIKIEN